VPSVDSAHRSTDEPGVCSAETASMEEAQEHVLAGRAGLRDGRCSGAGNIGRVSGAAWHPVDLPEGLPRENPGRRADRGKVRAPKGCTPGRRAVGLRQVDGMPWRGRGETEAESVAFIVCTALGLHVGDTSAIQ
jgi:hypothetical protein